MSARESVIQALINVGYGERQARELLSLALGEAQQRGFETGRRAARAEVLREAARLVEDAACDADFTEEPLFIAGLRSAAERLNRAASSSTPNPSDDLCRCGHRRDAHYIDGVHKGEFSHGCRDCPHGDWAWCHPFEAATVAGSPDSTAGGEQPETSPWQRAVDGLNALVDADIPVHIEPDGHISNPCGDEHIEWNRETSRWQLVVDEEVAS